MDPSPERHPGIRFDKISARSWVGLVFTITFMVVMLLSVSELRWFFILSIPPALAIAGILHVLNRREGSRNLHARVVSGDDLDEDPGIRIHKIPVKSWAGLLFAVGVMSLFFVGLPQVRWFFVLALPVGVLIGVALYLYDRR